MIMHLCTASSGYCCYGIITEQNVVIMSRKTVNCYSEQYMYVYYVYSRDHYFSATENTELCVES